MGDENEEDKMDKKRKKIADNVIKKMVDSGASQQDINHQQKVNKDTLGHEGDIE